MDFYKAVNQNYSKLSENELLIWEYIHNHPEKSANSSIDQLASACHFSKASIVRFAKKLGFEGFSELKVYMKLTLDKQKNLTNGDITNILCDSYIESINKARTENFDELFELMYNARRIYTYGSGQVQTSIAKELCRLFCNEGIYIYPLDNTVNYDALCRNLKQNDIVIIISTSGESKEIVQLANFLKLQGIKIVSFTKQHQNSLASLSDINYFFQSPKYEVISKSVDSSSIQFLICEILVLKYQDFIKQKHSFH